MNSISGNLIKGYQLKERIGAGGFGAVYRAEQSTVGREVAIKVILPGYANQPEFIRRFETEAQLVARLEHMHIVPLYDYWRDPEGAYLVMRLLRGGSLQQALQSGPYDLESAAVLLDQVAAGLMMAHRNQIVHRDIKPSNILLDEDGNAYLTDFGIAKALNMGVSVATDAGGIIGSPDYLAPEQARAEPVTPKTDIYSMGVVLYEMLTGEHPFKEAASIERLFHHINDPLPPIVGLEPDVTEGINKVIQKATTKNPEERYKDIIGLANAFREASGLSVSRAARSIVELLTPREQEVLKLMIEGKSNREIAEELVIETTTVKWYVRQIYKKLNVRSRVQAIVKARELKLIVDDFVSDATSPLAELPEPENPYKGLRAFQAVDEKDFYGRERIIQKLLSRMEGDEDYDRFLAVVGPSGSGKSSLVKAGLIPALWRGELPGSDRWYIVEMIPGLDPLEELETALIRIAAEHGTNIGEYLRRNENGLFRIPGLILPDDGSEIVVVIDQFEEVFTLMEDEDQRQYFLDLLVKAVTDNHSRIRVVVTLRADFYDRPLRYAEFGALMHNRVETVLPLSADELEQAIVQPAQRVGVLYEDGMVPMIIDEMLYQPGMLPLLQYALTELFEVREERMLTLEGYQQIGGAVGALGKRAEEIYLELDIEGQELVRQMFLRLVTLGEGKEDTRRRTAHAELLAVAQNPDLADEIIDTFTAYRLFSLDHEPETRVPVVEVAHEAILREWDRLRDWLDLSRDDIRQQRQLARATRDWERSEREDSFLLRGSRLEGFEDWRKKSDLSLTEVENVFLDASITAWDKEKAEAAERAAREQALEQRSRRILRALVGVFAAATVVTLFLAIFAFQQQEVAQDNAATAQAEAKARSTQQVIAEEETNARATQQAIAEGEADSRATQQAIAEANESEALAQKAIVEELAREAQRQADLNQNRFLVAESQVALQGNNYDLALALAMEAIQIENPPVEAELAFSEAAYSGGIFPTRDFIGHEDEIYGVGINPDSRSLVTAAMDNTIRQWDLQTGQEIRQMEIPGGQIDGWFGAAISPDGRQALVGLEDLSLILIDVESGEIIHHMAGHDASILVIKYSPDGLTALTGSGDRSDSPPTYTDFSMRLWDLETGEEIRRFEGHSEGVTDIVFMPDGWTALSVSGDGSMIRWDLETGEILQQIFNKDGELFTSVAISPDGRRAIANEDFGINLWDLESGQVIDKLGTHNVFPIRMTISPDGRMGVTGDREGEIRVWDLAEGKLSFRFQGHKGAATYLSFSEDGQNLYSGGPDKLRIWSLKNGAEMRRFEHEGMVRGVVYSPDGRTALSVEEEGALHLWGLGMGSEILRIELPDRGWDAAYTPDGSSAVVGLFNGDVIQYDLSTGEEMQRLGGEDELDGHFEYVVDAIEVSPDGKTALTGSQDSERNLFLWNLESGEALMEYEVPEAQGLDISPDGRRALVVGLYGLIELDLETGEEIQRMNGHENLVWDVAYSPDGKTALSSSWDSTLILWDLESGEMIHRLRGHFDHVRPVAIHPDGKTAVSGSRDGNLILWDLERGKVIRRYIGHGGQINNLAFSPDGQYVLSSDSEGLMIEWRVDDTLEELVAWAEANRSLRGLTCTEREQFNIEPLCE